MAYTTAAKVKTMFRDIQIDAATGNDETETAVTTETVDELIAEHTAFIDGRLSEYYITPITGTTSLVIVGRICKLLVAYDIKLILESIDNFTDKKQDVQGNLRKQALEMLDNIMPNWDGDEWVDPMIQLPDASRQSISPKSSSLFASNGGTVTIKKGGDNW